MTAGRRRKLVIQTKAKRLCVEPLVASGSLLVLKSPALGKAMGWEGETWSLSTGDAGLELLESVIRQTWRRLFNTSRSNQINAALDCSVFVHWLTRKKYKNTDVWNAIVQDNPRNLSTAVWKAGSCFDSLMALVPELPYQLREVQAGVRDY